MNAMFGFRDGKVWRVKVDGNVLPPEFPSRDALTEWFRAGRASGDFRDYYLLWGKK